MARSTRGELLDVIIIVVVACFGLRFLLTLGSLDFLGNSAQNLNSLLVRYLCCAA
jgi:hypothetical protein